MFQDFFHTFANGIIGFPCVANIISKLKNERPMKSFLVSFLTIVYGLLTLCSCGKEVLIEDSDEANSRLTIQTRGIDDSEDTFIATPVRLYVFASDGKCVTIQTLEDEETPFSIDLPVGVYDIYAIGGAEDSRLVLPTQENASKTSIIRPQEGKMLDDLMTGHATVTLSANDTNLLTLGMERKVIRIKSIVIKDVPDMVTDVSVSISPLYESLLLNGSWQGENGSITIPLKRQTDGSTWKERIADIYAMPSVGKPTITVNIGNNHYSYTCAEELTANYKINIEGQYADNHYGSNVRLSGTMTGVTWAGEKSIKFRFDETGSKNLTDDDDEEEDTTVSNNTLKAGSFYKECYVLAVNGNQVTLLSPLKENRFLETNDSQNVKEEKIKARLAEWTVDGIDATWRLPTLSEAILLYAAKDARYPNGAKVIFFMNSANKASYLYDNGNSYACFSDNSGEIELNKDIASIAYLRPVTTITF